VGEPFSATVVDKADYQGARVYGHISNIDMSGRVDGHTSMMLQFDRLVMPDGRRAPIHAEIIELYHTPSGENVDVEGAIESTGQGRKAVEHTILARVLGRCSAASSEAAEAPGSAPSSAAPVAWAPLRSRAPQGLR
jgi:hypothetical protein